MQKTYKCTIWFLQQLHMVVGDLLVLAICSNACKGLTNLVKTVFLNAEKECFRHSMDNYIKHYAGSQYMYPTSQAYKREVHDEYVSVLRQDPKIAMFLYATHELLWYRSGFNPAIKCDYITNYIAEVFNNQIKDLKDLPICDLADKIRHMIMELHYKRRRIGRGY